MSDYYKFGDVQALHISRHLTGNGAQALQYVARSCRLDGKNKDTTFKQIDDLKKARDFIDDEIERLKEVANG